MSIIMQELYIYYIIIQHITLVKEMMEFCWKTWHVVAMKICSLIVLILALGYIGVVTMKMLGLFVWEVSQYKFS